MQLVKHQNRIHVFKQSKPSLVSMGLLGCQETEGRAKWKRGRDKRKE